VLNQASDRPPRAVRRVILGKTNNIKRLGGEKVGILGGATEHQTVLAHKAGGATPGRGRRHQRSPHEPSRPVVHNARRAPAADFMAG
jgi:hypothetical protein